MAAATRRVHGTCSANGLSFRRRELRGQRLVGQQAEHGLLVRQFRAEAVHYADRAVAVGLDQRVPQIEARQELLHAQPPVHHVDLERPLAQHAIAVLELFRRDDLHRVAFVAEGVAEELVLAVAGKIRRAELHDGDIGAS